VTPGIQTAGHWPAPAVPRPVLVIHDSAVAGRAQRVAVAVMTKGRLSVRQDHPRSRELVL